MASNADDLLADAWTSGAYEELAIGYLPMVGRLAGSVPIDDGTHVLDIGCGTGSVGIAAAHSGATVTGLDLTPSLLERARENAEIAGYTDIEWQQGDAADLPFDSNRFEVTLSNLGHMYAEPAEAATTELVRVTKPGGHIAFTAWTPSSVYPTMAQVFLPYLSPEDLPDIGEPPFLWGEPGVVADRLEAALHDLQFETATVGYPVMSPAHFVDKHLRLSGVFSGLFQRVDSADHSSLRADLGDVVHESFDPDASAVELEYLLTRGEV